MDDIDCIQCGSHKVFIYHAELIKPADCEKSFFYSIAGTKCECRYLKIFHISCCHCGWVSTLTIPKLYQENSDELENNNLVWKRLEMRLKKANVQFHIRRINE